MKKVILAGMVGLMSLPAISGVWESQNTWNTEWENKYARWVEFEFNHDIFSNPESDYYGIKTDCADAVYTMRAIFAFENNLPFKINCPWTRSSTCTISNDTHKYDHISDSYDRFVAFLNKTHDSVSTHSVARDTYPPFINRTSLKAGSVFLQYDTSRSSQHVDIVKKFAPQGYGVFYSSTTPRVVRPLSIATSVPDLFGKPSGFRNWRSPELLKLSPARLKLMNLWSDEQHDVVFKDLYRKDSALKKRMAMSGQEESAKDYAKRILKDLVAYAKARVDAVNKGYTFCSVNNCDPGHIYNLYSTPSRDKKLLKKFKSYIAAQTTVDQDSWFEPSAKSELKDIKIEHISGQSIDLWSVYNLLKEGKMSTDPRADLYARWGQ